MAIENTRNSGLRERTHESVDRVFDKADSMEESGTAAMARLRDKGVMMRQNFDSRIQNNPEKSILIAAGIGAVAGAVVTAVMMRRNR